MKNRKKRVEVIVEIINRQCVGSQEELANLLLAEGYKVTQATLSRDLKMLKTTKVPTDRGTYMYILPDTNVIKDKLLATGQTDLNGNHQGGFVSLKFSGNIAVIKTRNGYAPGIAYDIDISNVEEIIGTIPGTDTIIAVLADGVSHERARQVLSKFLPLDNKIPKY